MLFCDDFPGSKFIGRSGSQEISEWFDLCVVQVETKIWASSLIFRYHAGEVLLYVALPETMEVCITFPLITFMSSQMIYWPYLQTAISSILSHFQQTIHRKGVCGEANKQTNKTLKEGTLLWCCLFIPLYKKAKAHWTGWVITYMKQKSQAQIFTYLKRIIWYIGHTWSNVSYLFL